MTWHTKPLSFEVHSPARRDFSRTPTAYFSKLSASTAATAETCYIRFSRELSIKHMTSQRSPFGSLYLEWPHRVPALLQSTRYSVAVICQS
jgi:hypothetical protein